MSKAEKRAALNLISDLLRDGLISYNTSVKMRERWI